MSAASALIRTLKLALGFAIAAVPVTAALPTPVQNVATLTYQDRDGERTLPSNIVSFEPLEIAKLPTSVSFHQLPPGYAFKGLGCRTTPSVGFTPGEVDADQLAAAKPLASLDIDDAVILVLDAQGENRDPLVRETALVRVDASGVKAAMSLLETGANTGVFAGALPASGAFAQDRACDLPLIRGTSIRLAFAEDQYSYSSSADLVIDPQGFVFDSRNGALIDGARVTVVDTATGRPARVFGQDGVSTYPATVVSGDFATDSGGGHYRFEKGNFRFPLLPPGDYRLRIEVPAGLRAPSSVAPEALQTLHGPEGAFHVIDASYGKVFTLAKTQPLFVDIPADSAHAGKLVLEKLASIEQAAPGDFIQYRLQLKNADAIAADALIVTDRLPIGLRYRSGSARGAAEPILSGDGRKLRFAVPTLAGGAVATITYVVEVTPGAPVGLALNSAVATGAMGVGSNEASASVRLEPLLFTDAITIVGRVTEGDCGTPSTGRKGLAGIRLMIEDGTLVVTDRDGLYHFEGVRPGTHVVQIDMRSVPTSLVPVGCDADTRQAGNAISRFVEGTGGSLQRVDFQLKRTGKDVDTAAETLPITVLDDAVAAGNGPDWFAGITPGIDWLFPGADHNPRASAVRVVIKHAAGQRVALRINGAQVDPLSFDGTDLDPTGGIAVSRWTGIPLHDRDNMLEARILDERGAVVQTLTRTVHYANVPVRAAFVPAQSRLVADGLTRPLIAVRVLDRDGKPVRAGTMIAFTVDAPYQPSEDVALQQGRELTGQKRADNLARVAGDEGLAFIALQPTMQSGAAHVSVTLTEEGVSQLSQFKAWLEPSAKDWVVVGFGRGTLGYRRLRQRSEPVAHTSDVVTDGQLALYAKGRIKGSWLLTLAYDSDRKFDRSRGLLGTIDPDRYYTVYGDGTQQVYDAPTRGKLYLRLERRQFYALFGDYETGMTETKLTRYSRTMNGVKAEYQGDRITFTAFAANDDQLYGRDEIQGNGLSGPYRLTGRDIVPNSDKITLETRDRFRSEKIVESVTMTRHIDYDIDPSAGTIRFKEPILSRDKDLNPIFIVVDYETYGRGKKLAAGGRAAARLFGGRVEIGASVLHDESVGKATVAGLDLKAHINATTELRAELATGGRDGIRKGQSGLVELEHHDGHGDILAYARQQDSDFGLGQQNFGEAGTRKLGVDGRLRITDRLNLTGSGWYQNDLDGTARRAAGEGRLEYRMTRGTVFIGAEGAMDRGIGGTHRDSRLITLGATRNFFGNKLELSAKTGFAIGGDDASVDFPVRHQIGVSYRFTDHIRLIAEHEIADGAAFKAHGTRIGFDVTPWKGGHVTTTMNDQMIGENGARAFAQYGLNQSLPIGKHWTVDATLDASSTVKGQIPQSDIVNPFQPVASGGFLGQDQRDGDYKAATLGATYRGASWTWNGRVEYRNSDASNRIGLTSNILRSLGEGKTIASSVRAYRVRDRTGAEVSFASADIALAWRPLESRWSLLERFELRREAADRGFTADNVLAVPTFAQGDQTTFRAINNLAVNYRSGDEGDGHGFEATLYHGAKYVRGRFATDVYDGFIDVIGAEIREDIGARFDIGINAGMQHAWSSGTKAFSIGPSIGVTPAKNVWLTAGYNVKGYRDRDFEDARYTRQGPYITMRMKFDQLSLGAAGRALKGIAP